ADHHRRRRSDRRREHGHRLTGAARAAPRERGDQGVRPPDRPRPGLRAEQERVDAGQRPDPHRGRGDPPHRQVVLRAGHRGARAGAARCRVRRPAPRAAAWTLLGPPRLRPGGAAAAGRRRRRPHRPAHRRRARRAAPARSADGLRRRQRDRSDERADRRRRRRPRRHGAPGAPRPHAHRAHRRRSVRSPQLPRARRPPGGLDVGPAHGRAVSGAVPGRRRLLHRRRRAAGHAAAARARRPADSGLRRLRRDGVRSARRSPRGGAGRPPSDVGGRRGRPRARRPVRPHDRRAAGGRPGTLGRPDAARHPGRHLHALERAPAAPGLARAAVLHGTGLPARVTGSL
ncbi:MAG: hypothetical protein AVDCRST_MAG16-711, partial [uncultured Frankineae bacterium]